MHGTGILLLALANAPFALTLPQHALAATATSFRDTPTLAASVDYGKILVPVLDNGTAIDAQDVCPGYTATKVQKTASGINALLSLKGSACNVYGTDIE
jgi:alpha-glucosidase